MRCPDCGRRFEVLDSKIYDYTESALGCSVTGHWPKYTARVYIDNVELLECSCGVAPNVPRLSGLQMCLFGDTPAENVKAGKIPIDPYSGLVYVGTWDDGTESWTISQHQEQ